MNKSSRIWWMRGKTYSYLNDSIDEDENKNKLFRKKQNRCREPKIIS